MFEGDQNLKLPRVGGWCGNQKEERHKPEMVRMRKVEDFPSENRIKVKLKSPPKSWMLLLYLK